MCCNITHNAPDGSNNSTVSPPFSRSVTLLVLTLSLCTGRWELITGWDGEWHQSGVKMWRIAQAPEPDEGLAVRQSVSDGVGERKNSAGERLFWTVAVIKGPHDEPSALLKSSNQTPLPSSPRVSLMMSFSVICSRSLPLSFSFYFISVGDQRRYVMGHKLMTIQLYLAWLFYIIVHHIYTNMVDCIVFFSGIQSWYPLFIFLYKEFQIFSLTKTQMPLKLIAVKVF